MELAQKIESLLVLYLKDQDFPESLDPELILPGESDEDKTDQIIQVACGDATAEDPPFSGNFWCPVDIQLRTPTGNDIEEHRSAAEVLFNAMLDSDFIASINDLAAAQSGELVNFAAIGFTDRQPQRGQEENYWMSGFTLSLYACGNAAAG